MRTRDGEIRQQDRNHRRGHWRVPDLRAERYILRLPARGLLAKAVHSRVVQVVATRTEALVRGPWSNKTLSLFRAEFSLVEYD